MTDLYTGNSAYPPPSQVRLPTDDMPQRASSYNPAFQDLADQVAYQARLYGPERMGSIADMQAITDARDGELFHVTNSGYYQYFGGVLAARVPIVYAATGMGAGAWVSDLYAILFNASNPAKIVPALIGNAIVKAGGLLVVGTSVVTSFSVSSYANVKDDGGADVAATGGSALTGVLSGDQLYLTVGPLSLLVGGGSHTAKFRTHIQQGATDTYYEQQYIDDGGSGWHFHVHDSIRHTCIDGDLSIFLEVASVSGSHSIQSPGNWGPAGRFEWGHYQLVRP
jgi:hypothetical protein